MNKMTSDDIFEALFRQVNDEVGLTKLRNIVLTDKNLKCLSFRRADADPIEFIKVVRCKDCQCHGTCRYEQYLGLDGYCSKGEKERGKE